MPGFINAHARRVGLQPYLGQRQARYAVIAASATASVLGMSAQAEGSSSSRPTPAATNILTRAVRGEYVSAATSNATCGFRDSNGGDYRVSGFLFQCVFGFNDAAPVANSRSFVGLSSNSSTGFLGSDPSAATNIVGFGHDSGDAQIHFMHNDGSGTAVKVPLGVSFDPQSVGELYEATIYCEPNGSSVHYSLVKISDGTSVEGTVSSDLPVSTQQLFGRANRGNGTTLLAVTMAFCSMYQEREFA